MLTARAFCIARRSARLDSGSGPPALTAIVISLPMRANCFEMRSQRANIVCLRVSKMRPMAGALAHALLDRVALAAHEVLEGDHLGDQAGGEDLDAEQHQQDSQEQQRPVGQELAAEEPQVGEVEVD